MFFFFCALYSSSYENNQWKSFGSTRLYISQNCVVYAYYYYIVDVVVTDRINIWDLPNLVFFLSHAHPLYCHPPYIALFCKKRNQTPPRGRVDTASHMQSSTLFSPPACIKKPISFYFTIAPSTYTSLYSTLGYCKTRWSRENN